MKLPKLPKMPKLPKFGFKRRQKRLHANAATRRAPAADDYYDEEPKTNLSSAFVVVLVLHVVFVGGIYAFNSIKAARRGQDSTGPASTVTPAGAPLVAKGTAPLPDASTPEPASTRSTTSATPAANAQGHVYQIKSGDTLTRIAGLFGVTVADLEEANGLKSGAGVRAGSSLTIPNVKPATKTVAAPPVAQDPRKAAFLATRAEATPAVNATAKSGAKSYTVAKGDTPTSIAHKFGTTADELLKLNKIDDPKKLQPGQNLKLPVKKAN